MTYHGFVFMLFLIGLLALVWIAFMATLAVWMLNKIMQYLSVSWPGFSVSK